MKRIPIITPAGMAVCAVIAEWAARGYRVVARLDGRLWAVPQ